MKDYEDFVNEEHHPNENIEYDTKYSIEKKFIITVQFDKKHGGVPYEWRDLKRYAKDFPERIIGFKRNKNETLFTIIKNCEEIKK